MSNNCNDAAGNPLKSNLSEGNNNFVNIDDPAQNIKNSSSIDNDIDHNIYTGVLEISIDKRYGFLRNVNVTGTDSSDRRLSREEYMRIKNTVPWSEDIYVSYNKISTFCLRSEDIVECSVNKPNDRGRFKTINTIRSINFIDPEESINRINFYNLVPVYPDKQIILSTDKSILSTRIIDLFAPIGFGQRGLIVAPPKSGKTMLLIDMANGISTNYPDVELLVLLVCERPEEVTYIREHVKGTVIASTFDEPYKKQVEVASFALGLAKASVEYGKNVVILMDSITRLARAWNIVTPSSGKVLSGGLEANALDYPKKFFGAARNTRNNCSLTIIATALLDTSSKMDSVIFEEFKGTGNMELMLDRSLYDLRMFPAINVLQSGTRNDNLLLCDKLSRIQILRRFLSGKQPIEVIDFLKEKMCVTNNNEEFLDSMNS